MKSKNEHCDSATFALCTDALLREAHADSSYIAAALAATVKELPDTAALILTDDELPFVKRSVREAYSDILTRLAAYTEDCSIDEGDNLLTFSLRLPKSRHKATDELLLHELQRAFVARILSDWYSVRFPDEAARQRLLYEAALSTIRHDIFTAYGGMKRKGSYF